MRRSTSRDEGCRLWRQLRSSCRLEATGLAPWSVTGKKARHLETSTGTLKTFETRLIPQVIGGRRVDTVYLIRGGRPGNIAVGPIRLAFLDEDELNGTIFVQRAGFAVVDGAMICILDAYHKE